MDNDKLKSGDVHFHNILDLDAEYISNLRNWRNQDFVREKMFNQGLISEDEHGKFIEHLREISEKRLYICFIGEKAFGVLDYNLFINNNSLEFGYYLIEQGYTNSGLGIVMEYALLNHAFYDLNVHKVFCRTLSNNEKVISLHKNFGFLTEGVMKQHIKMVNRYMDVTIQAIYESIWRDNRIVIEKLLKVMLGNNNIGRIEERC
ncbi:MAG: hypothetical protein BWY64_02453 [bacterium ADurb.Bin363]|nr:MAG: hypothetical protein BWY64_02453 [bacterium ADurb.Bin363]